jgi:hypothetical protein
MNLNCMAIHGRCVANHSILYCFVILPYRICIHAQVRDEFPFHQPGMRLSASRRAAKEKQTICAILLNNATQDPFFFTKIERKTGGQSCDRFAGTREGKIHACPEEEISASRFAATRTRSR